MKSNSTRRGLGLGKGKGYSNIRASDKLVHQRAGQGKKTYSSLAESRMNKQPSYKFRIITVDFSNAKSMDRAKRIKSMLENKGFVLEKTKQIGLDKFMLNYRFKDKDGDGVPDHKDCKPNDPNHQDRPKTFRVDDKIAIVSEYKDARDGFNHFATLYIDGQELETAKEHYTNRTWEAYEFQTVMQKLVDKTDALNEQKKAQVREYLKKDHTDWSGFKSVGTVAQLGDVLGQTQKEKNEWKERMLKAGLGGKGLQMPEDWGKLSEDEKESRLNKVIALAKETGEKQSSPPTYEIQQEYELEPKYDSRASFYGKANIRGENGKTILRSYDTDVAYIKGGKAFVSGTYSTTTSRHIKEFLKQHGFKAESSKQMIEDYGEG